VGQPPIAHFINSIESLTWDGGAKKMRLLFARVFSLSTRVVDWY